MSLSILLPMVSIALLFVLVATHAWRRSYTTAIYVVSVAIAMNCFAMCEEKLAALVIVVGAIVALARAVVNTQNDKFIKRGQT